MKNRKKAASTARVSRGSIGANRVRSREKGEVAVSAIEVRIHRAAGRMESLFVQDRIPRRAAAALFRPVLESRLTSTGFACHGTALPGKELKYGQQRMDL
jgi:hypothetical protein